MKTIRMLHRTSFWLLLLFTLPLAPVLVLALEGVPSNSALLKVDAEVLKQWNQRYGPDITPKIQEFERAIVNLYPDVVLWSNLPGLRSGFVQPLHSPPGLNETCMEAAIGDLITSYSLVSQAGGNIYPEFDFSSKLDDDWMNRLLLAKAACRLSIAAAERGDWDKARERVEEAAHISDPERQLNSVLQAHVRNDVYNVYRRFLGLRPNASTSRRIIKSLESLSATDDSMADVRPLNLRQSWNWPLNPFHYVTAFFERNAMLLNSFQKISVNSQFLKSPENSDWIKFDAVSSNGPFSRGVFTNGWAFYFPWTNSLELPTRLRHIARTEPAIAEISHWNSYLKTGVDPAALLMYDAGVTYVEKSNAQSQTKALHVRNSLLQLAFAARVFHEKQDRWPDSTDELYPDYVGFKPETLGKMNIWDSSIRSYELKMIPVTTGVLRQMFQLYCSFSLYGYNTTSENDEAVPYFDITLTRIDNNMLHARVVVVFRLKQAIRFLEALNIAEFFKSKHADFVSTVTVLSGIGQSSPLERHKPVDLDSALKQAWEDANLTKTLCSDLPSTGSHYLPGYQISIEMNLPEKVLAVYVPEAKVSIKPLPSRLLDSKVSEEDLIYRFIEFPEGW